MSFIINPYLFAAATDADADAFISAAGITDSTQQGAIQTLVTDLKGYGIWTKMKCIYPFVGGTSNSHKYNLKDTTQYQISWFGGITHSSNGVLPGGTNGYARNGFYYETALSGLTPQNQHISYYSRTNNAGGYEHSIGQLLILRYSNGNAYYSVDGISPNGPNSNGSGFFIGTATSSTVTLYRNSTSILTGTTSSTSYGYSIYQSTLFEGDGVFGSKECAFHSIGLGLTATESANFNTAVQAFQTTLSRNV